MIHLSRPCKSMLTQQQKHHRRKRASPRQLAFLRKKFLEDPKPDQNAREAIGHQIDMTPRSVQIWFQNNRAKTKMRDKGYNSIHSLPLTTSSCGDKVSRIHVDVKALRKGEFYSRPDLSISAPNLPQSMKTTEECKEYTPMDAFEEFKTDYLDRESTSFDFEGSGNSELDFLFLDSELGSTLSEPVLHSRAPFNNPNSDTDSLSSIPSGLLTFDSNPSELMKEHYHQMEVQDSDVYIQDFDEQDSSTSFVDFYGFKGFKFDILGLKIKKWEMPDHVNSAHLLYSPDQQKARIVLNENVGFDCRVSGIHALSDEYITIKFSLKPHCWIINDQVLTLTHMDFTNGQLEETDELNLYGCFDKFLQLYGETKQLRGSVKPQDKFYKESGAQMNAQGFYRSASDHRLSFLMTSLP